MSSVIDTINFIIKLIDICIDICICIIIQLSYKILFSRTCDVFCKCQVLETPNPKLTIKCYTKNHRLFMHDENYITDRLVSSYSNLYVLVLIYIRK